MSNPLIIIGQFSPKYLAVMLPIIGPIIAPIVFDAFIRPKILFAFTSSLINFSESYINALSAPLMKAFPSAIMNSAIRNML